METEKQRLVINEANKYRNWNRVFAGGFFMAGVGTEYLYYQIASAKGLIDSVPTLDNLFQIINRYPNEGIILSAGTFLSLGVCAKSVHQFLKVEREYKDFIK